jgi:fumarate reductase subunit D
MTFHGRGYRLNLLWLAAMIHRISGLALAAFLPLHFLVLGLAIRDGERLNGFFRWTEEPLVKWAETLLIFFFTVHMFGGLRRARLSPARIGARKPPWQLASRL